MTVLKTVRHIYPAPPKHWVGDGFYVSSMFHYGETHKNVDPFLLMDYGSPMHFDAHTGQPRGVGEHPHRGFETVTIAYQGEVSHKDATGGNGTIHTGDVQWMTAGSGVMHEEFHSDEFSKAGGVFEMVQLWVNLPAKDKMTAPNYHTIKNADIPVVTLDKGSVRVIAGDFDGTHGTARPFSPLNLWDTRLQTGASHTFGVPDSHNLLILVLDGEILVNEQLVKPSQLVTFEKGGTEFNIQAKSDSKILILSGEPLNEPIAGHGPFVMNTREEILQAFDDLRSGKFVAIARD